MSSTPVTRQSLGQRALQRADYQNSQFISADELNQLVDTSLAKMHNLLVSLWEDYFLAEYDLPIVSNQDQYTLPPDFMKLRQVFYTDTSGYRWPLRRLNPVDLTNLPISINYTNIPAGYVLIGRKIVMFPKPANTELNKLHIFYIPTYSPPVADTQPIEYQVAFGWEEWAVNDIAVQIRNKAMMPSQELLAERENIGAQWMNEAKRRNVGDPPKVKDTGWGTNGLAYSRFSQFAIK